MDKGVAARPSKLALYGPRAFAEPVRDALKLLQASKPSERAALLDFLSPALEPDELDALIEECESLDFLGR